VWLEGTNLTTPRPSKKLEFKRFGPFPIISKHGTAYKLAIPPTWKNIHPVFHETLLSVKSALPTRNTILREPWTGLRVECLGAKSQSLEEVKKGG